MAVALKARKVNWRVPKMSTLVTSGTGMEYARITTAKPAMYPKREPTKRARIRERRFLARFFAFHPTQKKKRNGIGYRARVTAEVSASEGAYAEDGWTGPISSSK